MAVIHGFAIAGVSGIALEIAQTFHVELSVASEALVPSWWSGLIVIPLLAPGDRSGRKGSLLTLITLAALLAVGASFAPTLGLLKLAVTLLRGVGIAAAIMLLISSVEIAAPRMSGLSAGLMLTGGALGASLMPAVIPFFEESTGWQSALRLVGYATPVVVLLSVFLREPRTRTDRRLALWRPLAPPFVGIVLPLMGALALVAALTTVHVTALQDHLTSPGIWDVSQLRGALTAAGVAGAVSAVVVGFGSDKFGRKLAENASLVVAGLGSVATYFSGAPSVVTVGLISASAGLFGFAAANGAHRVELLPANLRAAGLAWISIAVGTGTSLGRYLIARETFDTKTLVALLAGGLIIAVGALTALPETRALATQQEAPIS